MDGLNKKGIGAALGWNILVNACRHLEKHGKDVESAAITTIEKSRRQLYWEADQNALEAIHAHLNWESEIYDLAEELEVA